MKFSEVFKNNEEWVKKKTESDPDYFKKLSQGQNPDILYIGCSDSRATAEELMGAEPGQVFVHRNIANQVNVLDSNINAVVQYAVDILKVKQIVICGHYECGGIRAALNATDMGQINNWLQGLRDVYRLHFKAVEAEKTMQKRFDKMVEYNVLEQAINVFKFDHVQRSISRTGYPKVHAWVFDVRTGKLIDLKVDIEREFAKLKEIYDLGISPE